MRLERESELRKHREQAEAKARETQQRHELRAAIKSDFYRLFGLSEPHVRGKLLESVLNRLFASHEVLVREAFTRRGDLGQGVVEQIDGVIELDGHIYLVEMKWLADSVGRGDLSEHLVRVYGRDGARGLFISATEYSPAAIEVCREALAQKTVALCTLQEMVWLLENEKSLIDFLRAKVRASVVDKRPFSSVLGAL